MTSHLCRVFLIWLRVLAVRITRSCVAASLLVALGGGAATAADRELRALVIGNGMYKSLGALPASRADVAAMAGILVKTGYQVAIAEDTAGAELRSKWAEFLAQLRSIKTREALSVFYFSGHGVDIENDTYLLPIDVPEQPTEVQILRDGFSLRRLLSDFRSRQDELLAGGTTMHGIVIMDVSRTSFARDTRTKGIFDKPSAAPWNTPPGIIVLYATSPGQSARSVLGNEPEGLPSVYTRHLVKLLERKNSLQATARQVRWEVYKATTGTGSDPQTPAYIDELPREMTLSGDPAEKTIDPAPTSAPRWQQLGATVLECEDCPELVIVPGGEFDMGSPRTEPGHEPPEEHAGVGESDDPRLHVKIGRPIAIGLKEVTVHQFRAYLSEAFDGTCPPSQAVCAAQNAELPAAGVSWHEAMSYIAFVNRKLGLDSTGQSSTGYYRLPTEAEWEYVARAGSKSSFTHGDDPGMLCLFARVANNETGSLLGHVDCWGRRFEQRGVAAAGEYKPNAFGLYDVQGNVWEWVADCWSDRLVEAKTNGGAYDEPGCQRRIARGGSWRSPPSSLRLAKRVAFKAEDRWPVLGFRVLRVLPLESR